MKFLAVLCLILIAFAFAAANNHGCNNQPCGQGRICHTLRGFCSCVEIQKCKDVELFSKIMNQWEVDGKVFTQYDVSISNNLDADISQIYIGTDASLTLRDYASIWNVNRLPNGELTLPGYQPSINKNSTYTFGFILKGNTSANLAILATVFN
ncbi:hypothetical protein DICPUDRAFT_79711 [Dictyostelium purpureum]|uniref:Carbohydrate binding domain-containing protein n=1 Tax=Dictyostelium purpureum TaxID=5786 RepID=F0ZNE1_DICPU|nr:uncharacterized protein DICPUDRAFT_79711 [Dictyostelium purpureum]EGC34549.1 hypothetical protein DICPUDRAFT_79711 [Dictyostelium purpureum]|eukprot:XP_003288925.1 hypothetical protein DICPUDRAFT_79711 [Dictyostelium purpureum]